MTPQHCTFVSNKLTDFDGDGCADGLEVRCARGGKQQHIKLDISHTSPSFRFVRQKGCEAQLHKRAHNTCLKRHSHTNIKETRPCP